ncbi:plasmid recombination protein [Eubacteriales bacterium OttesenSCG-928-K08]|nr:plasmid recombination protein [Eubacteriales bacterium OttesenSCG-928-K08]
MPYPILRFAKRKAGAVGAVYRHNERMKEAYKSNPDIDPARAHLNYHLKAPEQTYRKEIDRLIEQAGCRKRSDSVLMVDTIMTASPEFLQALPDQEQREYFQRAYVYMRDKLGEQNILSAAVHMDEKTPHMHLSFCPINVNGKLSAKSLLGSPAQLSKWQTEFHKHMSARWPELERGVSKIETQREHVPVWLFKKAEQLDKEAGRIREALSDISAFNAGKKRDAALALLSKWLPEAEKFTAQVKTVDAHICKLEQAYEHERGQAVHYRSKALNNAESLEYKEMELEYLKKQYFKQKAILERIPPDVLEQVKQKKHKVKER